MPDKPVFSIGAEGIDTEKLVAEIRQTVAEKTRRGAYDGAWTARAKRFNLQDLRGDEFLTLYLDSLREAVYVDIGDFEITERRKRFAPFLVRLKRVIWSLLRFYTYRLWSQQNDVNGLLLAAVEGVDQRYRDRLNELEARVAKLEQSRRNDP